jgi:hypothetical protein
MAVKMSGVVQGVHRGLLLLFLLATAAFAMPVPAPPSQPVPVGYLADRTGQRDDALLCYHADAAYYVKLPHPLFGNQGLLYQRVTPGASGHMNAFELRLYNNYPGSVRHVGILSLTVHRRVGGLPGPFEQMVSLDADTVGNTILTLPLDTPFPFSLGEEFYLGLAFQPAASVDTVAYVTASLGSYSGHSFFLMSNQVMWWGDQLGTPFGDMHYCADVWLDNTQAHLHFPWTQLDLGRGRAGHPLELEVPLINQGTGPLIVNQASVAGPDWSCRLVGPDSLMPPDTLLLCLAWNAPQVDTVSTSLLTLQSNAANEANRQLTLNAASSTADLLLADWDEWDVATAQLGAEGPATGNWSLYRGLGRPEPFMGHSMPAGGLVVQDILYLRGLFLRQGDQLRLRWAQYQRNRSAMVQHALAWRDPLTAQWQVLAEPDLGSPDWLGPEGEWFTVPWHTWTAPSTGLHDLGLLYGGTNAVDMWFIDDLEVDLLAPIQAPELRIHAFCGHALLLWNPVLGAEYYRIERVDRTPHQVLGHTATCAWTHRHALRLGRAQYRVIAVGRDEAGAPPPPMPVMWEAEDP